MCADTGPYGMGWVADVHHGLDRAIDYPLANHSDPTLAGKGLLLYFLVCVPTIREIRDFYREL
eukprot:SAG31_NODE_3484_length_4213_cov_33.947496_2_plen_63_part_00